MMNAATANLTKSLKAEMLRCLAGGIDTPKADGFLDQLFEVAEALGSVTCMLAGDRVLRVQSRDLVLQDVEIPLAKTKLRMLCARLAVRCGEWANRKLAPYGDLVEFRLPVTNQLFKVHYENTTSKQAFAIDVGSSPVQLQ